MSQFRICRFLLCWRTARLWPSSLRGKVHSHECRHFWILYDTQWEGHFASFILPENAWIIQYSETDQMVYTSGAGDSHKSPRNKSPLLSTLGQIKKLGIKHKYCKWSLFIYTTNACKYKKWISFTDRPVSKSKSKSKISDLQHLQKSSYRP